MTHLFKSEASAMPIDTAFSITSADNPKFKHVRGLLDSSRQRKKAGQTVLEGIHLLESLAEKCHGELPITPKQVWLSDALIDDPDIASLVDTWEHTPCFVLPEKLYKQLRSLGTGVDVLAVIDIPQNTLTTLSEDTLVLNDVQDIGNVGTLLRTAAAIGIAHVVCTPGTASLWSPKCLRAGMGAQFSLALYEHVAPQQALEHIQARWVATSSHADKNIYQFDLNTPIAWVLGNEGQGVCEAFMQSANTVSLPQPNGQESLNVSIAGSVCMYEMLRQREFA